MHKIVYGCIFLLLAIAAIFVITGGNPLSALSVLQQSPQPKGEGFSLSNEFNESRKVAFDDVSEKVVQTGVNWESPDAKQIANETKENTHIHLIRGHDLDPSGSASTWLFVIRKPDGVSMVTYDYQGEKISSWEARFPEQEILLNQTLTPRDLFSRNHAAIFPADKTMTGELIDLDLARNIYYLTITGSSTSRTLKFDAVTGAMIPSND